MSKEVYSIPLRYRKMENLHILFWLLKDISWCLVWKPLGIAMIFPTLIMAVVIAVRTRKNISEACHNIAVVAWISANSYWMISEFLNFDATSLVGEFTYRHLALIPFLAGLLPLVYFYAWWRPRHGNAIEKM